MTFRPFIAPLFALVAVLPLPALAQVVAPATKADVTAVDRRVGKLESEMKAVQRKVFPGGSSRYFEPEITAPVQAPADVAGTPASQPLVDLATRVGELERQLRTLTGQVEAAQFKARQLEEAQTRLRGDVEFRLGALEKQVLPQADPQGAPAEPGALPSSAGAAPAALPGRSAPVPAAAPQSPKKAATAVLAWQAAYDLVLAKKWPATQTAMTDYIADWPKSTRIPQAKYWLGRSHAERAQHAEAAKAFLDVYQTAPRSDSAHPSLIGLATALIGLKKPAEACRVLGELENEFYAAKITPAQATEVKTLRTRGKC